MQLALTAALRSAAMVVGALVLIAAPARAIQVQLEIFTGGVATGSLGSEALGCVDTGPNTGSCSGAGLVVGDLYLENWNFNLDTDPVVGAGIAVQNLSLATQQFTMIVTLPITPILGATFTGGSVAGGVTDNDGNTATLSTVAGSAFYTALIDAAAYQTLLVDPISLTTNPYDSADLPSPAFGVPIPSQVGPAALASIGIQLDFNLTAQDSASFTGVFVVEPVPEPNTLMLMGLGLFAVGRAVRAR